MNRAARLAVAVLLLAALARARLSGKRIGGARLNAAPVAPPLLIDLGAEHNRSRAAAPAAVAAAAPGAAQMPGAGLGGFDPDIRPNEGGAPDVIQYGLYVKGVKNIRMGKGSFRADVVLTLRWTDPRTKSLVPPGIREHTLAPDVAKEMMWMPDIRVSNRKIGGLEVISSAITVGVDGKVEKTERLIIVCMNKFDVGRFPFDSQTLKVIVASTTLMSKELKLSPIKDETLMGVKDGVFQGTDLSMAEARAIVVEEVDGSLQKSRGELLIKVHRHAQVYLRKKLLPELFLVAISWTVFYFPLKPPFAMPRVATSLISYLSFTTLAGKTGLGIGQTWLDVFEESVVISLWLTVFLNIFVEITSHTLEKPNIAQKMDYELKFLLPLMALITFAILFIGIGWGVWLLSILTRLVSLIGPVAYFASCLARFPDLKTAISAYRAKVTKPLEE